MKILFICVGIILLVSIITYIIGSILEYRKKKVINEINKQLESIYEDK